MDEQVFFNQDGISVSNARFVVNGQTYAMSSVTSVKQAVKAPSLGAPIIVGLAGVVICLVGNVTAVVAGLVTLAIAIVWGVLQRTEYIVVLNTSSGESQAFKSNSRPYVEAIINALNQSIVHRG